MSKINFCEVFENIADKAEQCEQISKTIEHISRGATKMENEQDEIYKSLKDIINNCLMIRKELVEVERAVQISARELKRYIEE